MTGVFVAVLMLGVALGFPGQLGLGDVGLAGTIATSLGWLSPATAALGFAAGCAVQMMVVIGMTWRARGQGVKLPLGPALLAGWLLAITTSGALGLS
ncbi:hypothetical protein FB565_002980 [Actinoplanes lutulentus]|nr:hypothetical protein [Actinoplanes lutulentus]